MPASAVRVAQRHLTMQKKAYLAISPHPLSFGLTGPASEEAGRVLASAVEDAMNTTKASAHHAWKHIASELLKFDDLDTDPGKSRAACSSGLRFLYLNLADNVMDYFDKL